MSPHPDSLPPQRPSSETTAGLLRLICTPLGCFRTREKTLRSLHTLAWVVPLTLLIWAYAEREQQIKDTVVVPLEVASDTPERIVSVARAADRNVTLELEGSRAAIEQVKVMFTPQRPLRIVIPKAELPNDPAIREVPLVLLDRVARNEGVSRAGVAVHKINPPYLMVLVDQMATRRLPVEASPDDEQRLGRIVIQAERVRVVGPRSLFLEAEDEPRYKRYLKNGKLAVFADLSVLKDPKPGRYDDVDLPITFPIPDRPVQIPARVRATIEIIPAQKEKLVLSSVPVWRVASGPILNQYRIDCDDVLKNVTVVGPPRQIALLKGDAPASHYALLRVAGDDPALRSPGVERTRKLTNEDFFLPPEVTIEGEYEVRYKITAAPRGWP